LKEKRKKHPEVLTIRDGTLYCT